MKISENQFKCEWCNHLQKKERGVMHGVTCKYRGQVVCSKCGRYIKQ